MLKKKTAILAGILSGALVLGACGSGSDPLDTDSSTGDAATDTDNGAADIGDEPEAPEVPDTEQADDSPSDSEGDAAADVGPIVVGSANFIESELLAEIYAGALAAQGFDVSTHLDIGARETYIQALEEGSISVFPEYTGGLLAYYDPDSEATAPEDVYEDLVAALPDDLQVLAYADAENKDSVTVTRETADKYGLQSIGDLADVAGELKLGGSPEWQTRADGPEGMKKVYGVEFASYTVLDPGGPLSVKGLITGLVDATDIFTTTPAIEENDFVVLDDPENLFQAQNIVPLVATSVVSDDVIDTLNAVSAALTTEDLTSMQKTIADTKADPAVVAGQWLDDNALS